MPTEKIILEFQQQMGLSREEFLQALQNTRGNQTSQITAFYRQLADQLITDLQEEGIRPEDAERWVRDRIGEAVQSNELRDLMLDRLSGDLQRVQRYLAESFDLLDRNYNLQEARILARGTIGQYALKGSKKIGDRLAVEIGALSQIYEKEELYDLIRDKINLTDHRVRVVADNIVRGFDSEVMFELSEQTGLFLYRYEGTLVEHSRTFCRHLVRLDYVYTRPQILQMDNGHGLQAFTFRGGYNCRHGWGPGEEGWPGFENPYPPGGPFITLMAEAGSTLITVPQG